MVEAPNAGDVIKQQIELDNSIKTLAASAASERKASDDRVVINSRGERRVLRVIETPLHGSGDAALGGYAIDSTALDKTKSDLRQHIEANQRTLDQIQTAVAIFGASQNLIYHNRAFQDLWSLEDSDLSGRTYHGEILDKLRLAGSLPEPADYDAWKKLQLALYTEGLAAPGSERDGGAPDEIWHLPDGRTLRVAKQRHPLGGVMAAFEDITEKISLEAQYNTQISVQKATLNNLNEGVAVFAADGSLRLYNKAFQKIWRLRAKMLDNKPHVDLIIEQLQSRAPNASENLAALRRCVTSKSPEDRTPLDAIEVTMDDERTLSFGTEPLPDGATLAHFLDVTDSKEREKELKERKRHSRKRRPVEIEICRSRFLSAQNAAFDDHRFFGNARRPDVRRVERSAKRLRRQRFFPRPIICAISSTTSSILPQSTPVSWSLSAKQRISAGCLKVLRLLPR